MLRCKPTNGQGERSQKRKIRWRGVSHSLWLQTRHGEDHARKQKVIILLFMLSGQFRVIRPITYSLLCMRKKSVSHRLDQNTLVWLVAFIALYEKLATQFGLYAHWLRQPRSLHGGTRLRDRPKEGSLLLELTPARECASLATVHGPSLCTSSSAAWVNWIFFCCAISAKWP